MSMNLEDARAASNLHDDEVELDKLPLNIGGT